MKIAALLQCTVAFYEGAVNVFMMLGVSPVLKWGKAQCLSEESSYTSDLCSGCMSNIKAKTDYIIS